MIELTYAPVVASNWADLEKLFESKGGPHYCWCMVWRKMEPGLDRANKNDKKTSLQQGYVHAQTPIGILAYANAEPIAWCSIAPRSSHRELSGDKSLADVWSLTCFFIKKEYPGEGIAKNLIQQAIKYAKENGAKYVEAYPVDLASPSYKFMGVKPLFDALGFAFKHKAGERRYVMTIAV